MDRLKLLLMPLKHQPDFIYLRHVPLRRVHLFTFLQVVCLALLWILKSTVAAIIFPVMVGDALLRLRSPGLPHVADAPTNGHILHTIDNVAVAAVTEILWRKTNLES